MIKTRSPHHSTWGTTSATSPRRRGCRPAKGPAVEESDKSGSGSKSNGLTPEFSASGKLTRGRSPDLLAGNDSAVRAASHASAHRCARTSSAAGAILP